MTSKLKLIGLIIVSGVFTLFFGWMTYVSISSAGSFADKAAYFVFLTLVTLVLLSILLIAISKLVRVSWLENFFVKVGQGALLLLGGLGSIVGIVIIIFFIFIACYGIWRHFFGPI